MGPLKHKPAKPHYLRCINKDTLDYVDVMIPSGSGSDVRNDLLKHADFLSGNWDWFSGKKIKKYHYYFILSSEDLKAKPEHLPGQRLNKLRERIEVNTNTLKIITTTPMPKPENGIPVEGLAD